MKQKTSVLYAGIEYDIVQEGSSQYRWYQLCQVLHRDQHGTIDHYIRLRGYGLPRYKREALALLTDIATNGPKDYKEPKDTRKQRYVLGYHLVQVTAEWAKGKPYYVPPVTRKFYHIVEINDPYILKNRQIRKEYRGHEMDQFTYQDYLNRAKIEAVIKQLNRAFWQERAASMSPFIVEVDRRPKG